MLPAPVSQEQHNGAPSNERCTDLTGNAYPADAQAYELQVSLC